MKFAVYVALVALSSVSYAQDFPRKEFNLEKLADEIFPQQDLDLNYEELYENLAQLLSNPIDLNTITHEQLRSLFVISEEKINSFLAYRRENSPLLSVYELQSVPGWDRTDFDNIIPFVIVSAAETKFDLSILSRLSHEKNNYLLLRYDRTLEEKQGYQSETDSAQRYQGSPDRFYVRYRVARSNDFSFGFTAEKDPGEPMKWSPPQRQYGFDYLSLHIQLQNKGKLKNLIVGDFQCQFGQGLILGSVFGFGKNSETVTTVRRSNLGFLPYTSLNENLYFSGVAGSFELTRNFFLHTFGSHTYKDGHTNGNNDDGTIISSFPSSGLHRTLAEIQTRKQVSETDVGAVLQYKTPHIDGGLIFHGVEFNQPVVRNPSPYNQYAYTGLRNQNTGVYVNYSRGNFTFFSEAAHTVSAGSAFTAGLLGNIAGPLEIALLYRNFSRDFYSFASNAFAESTLPQNERGFYWGWKYRFNKRYAVSGYTDFFQFPWLRYRAYSPSEGSEWLLRFNYTPSKNVLMFLQIREESKTRNLSNDANLYTQANGIKRIYWINCDYSASPYLTFKTRAQFSTYQLNGVTTRGFALAQDVTASAGRWSISFRHALFDTDDYDNRIYFYERDVWLAYSFPAYFGVGVRNYVLVQYKLTRKIDIWLRWSHTRYINRTEIGSKGETIVGNTANDIKFQARISF